MPPNSGLPARREESRRRQADRAHLEIVAGALVAHFVTLPLVLLGVELGTGLLAPAGRPPSPRHLPPADDVVLDTLTLWDGQWYLEIAARGYS